MVSVGIDAAKLEQQEFCRKTRGCRFWRIVTLFFYKERDMEKNVGGIDRKIRYLVGAILLAGGLLAPLDMPWRAGMIVLAAIAFITAFTGL